MDRKAEYYVFLLMKSFVENGLRNDPEVVKKQIIMFLQKLGENFKFNKLLKLIKKKGV